jgi:hypothetical protein
VLVFSIVFGRRKAKIAVLTAKFTAEFQRLPAPISGWKRQMGQHRNPTLPILTPLISRAELNFYNTSQSRCRFCGLKVIFFKPIYTSLTKPLHRSTTFKMSWFEQITAKAAQVQSLEELEGTEARKKLEQRMLVTRNTIFAHVENQLLIGSHHIDVPDSFTLSELADAAREPLNSALSTKSRVSEGTPTYTNFFSC